MANSQKFIDLCSGDCQFDAFEVGLRAANVKPFKPLNGLNVNGGLLALTAAVTHLRPRNARRV